VARKHKSLGRSGSQDRVGNRDAEVRIIGGTFRGRRLNYHGDPVVRPMKDRTREAIFNLISTECTGAHAIDLFAGTGALGLEALSRGASTATFIEKHVPSARIVEQNIRTLAVEDRSTLLVTSAFLWAKRDLASATAALPDDKPWLVFCSPPYAFYHERQAEMLDLIDRIQQRAPAGSIVVIEADEQFDFDLLRGADSANAAVQWDVRSYAPAIIGLWRAA
jgi:16S rRNA (guanine966-N2)-methyltransferase